MQIRQSKVALFTSYRRTICTQFWEKIKKKWSCKNKIQLKNFVLKGNFKLFFLKFPEGVVWIILKTILIGSPLLTILFKHLIWKSFLEDQWCCPFAMLGHSGGGTVLDFLSCALAQCLAPNWHSVNHQLSDDSIVTVLVTATATATGDFWTLYNILMVLTVLQIPIG